jgi:hypothetical protein
VSRVLWFHEHWFYVATIMTGIVGLWGLGLAIAKRIPQRPFLAARAIAVAAMLVQIGAGLILYTGGRRPGNGFHVFYGVVIAVTLALAYVYRSTMNRSPALWYGLLLLFVMGLGLRAWANVN